MDLFLSVLAAGAYTVGGLFMRKADGFAHAVPAAMVFGCFGVGAALQTLAMRRSELSVNYILVLGLEAALALVLSIVWLGEAVSPLKLAGLVLILAGVMSLRLEERPNTDPHAALAAAVPAPAESVLREAAPREPRGTPSLASRRPRCQHTHHAPCR